MRLFLLFTSLLALLSCQSPEATNSNEATERPRFEITRGVNISHWLSQSDRRGEARATFFTEADVAALDSLGYDHLRLPVDEEQLWLEDGSKDSVGFKLLHDALGWCLERDLKVIVDLHIVRSFHFNRTDNTLFSDPAAQETWIELWRQLSAELKAYPTDMVAYELLNEPVADEHAQWNELVNRCLTVVRELEPERFVVIGPNKWQSLRNVATLDLPANDPYLLVSFHFYEPLLLTHYQASWLSSGDYDGPVQYPGPIVPDSMITPEFIAEMESYNANLNPFTLDTLEQLLAPARHFADSLDLDLYCGEWGCLNTVVDTDRLRWYADMRRTFEAHGIGWTNWDYKGNGFGIKDPETLQWREPLVAILLGEAPFP
jgi:endoglucanase